MAYICPRCYKSREATEKLVHKDSKAWLIEYCHVCQYNFEITEWSPKDVSKPAPPIIPQLNKKTKRFRFGLERDED